MLYNKHASGLAEVCSKLMVRYQRQRYRCAGLRSVRSFDESSRWTNYKGGGEDVLSFQGRYQIYYDDGEIIKISFSLAYTPMVFQASRLECSGELYAYVSQHPPRN